MPGRIAIAIAGRSGCAALGQGPGRRKTFARRLRQQPRIGLGRGAQTQRRYVGQIDEHLACGLGIDNCAAEEIGRGARHGQERCRNETAGRGFRHDNSIAALLQ